MWKLKQLCSDNFICQTFHVKAKQKINISWTFTVVNLNRFEIEFWYAFFKEDFLKSRVLGWKLNYQILKGFCAGSRVFLPFNEVSNCKFVEGRNFRNRCKNSALWLHFKKLLNFGSEEFFIWCAINLFLPFPTKGFTLQQICRQTIQCTNIGSLLRRFG